MVKCSEEWGHYFISPSQLLQLSLLTLPISKPSSSVSSSGSPPQLVDSLPSVPGQSASCSSVLSDSESFECDCQVR